jgi:hypothetical protein
LVSFAEVHLDLCIWQGKFEPQKTRDYVRPLLLLIDRCVLSFWIYELFVCSRKVILRSYSCVSSGDTQNMLLKAKEKQKVFSGISHSLKSSSFLSYNESNLVKLSSH